MPSNTELYHHGILGQKWGVRRYQNEDGTRTSLGEKHRDEIEGQTSTRKSHSSHFNTKQRHQLSDTDKELLKTAATVGLTLAAAYATPMLKQLGKEAAFKYGKSFAKSAVKEIPKIPMNQLNNYKTTVMIGSKALHGTSKVGKSLIKTSGKIANVSKAIYKMA